MDYSCVQVEFKVKLDVLSITVGRITTNREIFKLIQALMS
jgi:hypothetical protein